MIDKREIIINLLKNENDGLCLAYQEITKRIKILEKEKNEILKKLEKQQDTKENEESK